MDCVGLFGWKALAPIELWSPIFHATRMQINRASAPVGTGNNYGNRGCSFLIADSVARPPATRELFIRLLRVHNSNLHKINISCDSHAAGITTQSLAAGAMAD